MLQEFQLLVKFYHSIEILLIRDVIPEQYQKHGTSMKLRISKVLLSNSAWDKEFFSGVMSQ